MSDNLTKIIEYAKDLDCTVHNRNTSPGSAEITFCNHRFIIYTDVDMCNLDHDQQQEIMKARFSNGNVSTCLDAKAGEFIVRTEMQKAKAKRGA